MGTTVIDIVQEWKKFGLSGLQAELDDVAAAIAARQDDSEQSRRALVELTRDFRKNTPEEVRKQISPLLKSFQAEVDRLSTRGKTAETAFLNVYKKLIDMPDVTSALEYAHMAQTKLARMAELQLENVQLKETISNLSSELSQVTSQEVTIKQLKEEIRQYDTNRDTTIEERMQELEGELLREFQEREQTYHEQQLLQTRRLAEAEHKVAQLTSELDLSQTELFEVKAKFDTNSHARSDELDMVLVDLERANQRAALAEREVVSLKEQLALSVKRAQLADEGDVNADARRSATERQLASKDNEISQLVEDVQRLQTQLTELESQSVCQRARLQEELEHKNSVIHRLETILEQQKDYEELKKEFSILKSIEFPGTSQPSANDEGTASSGAKPLEVLMLEKSKAMQNENTALKVKAADLQARVDSLETDSERQQRTIEEQRRLVLKLEEDLGQMNSVAAMCRGEGEGQPSTSDMMAEAVRDTMETQTTGARRPASRWSPAADPGYAADTVLPIVTAQRERFRMRIQEMEQERHMVQNELALRISEVDDLRRDNVKLFEKIKFLQSYSAQKSSSVEVESRYSSQYEAHLDPFWSFSKRERHRKYSQLSPFEKITLSMGQLVLSNKGARTAVCVYTLLLHLLVFAVLYKMAYTDMYMREVNSDCAERYADHMLKIHGEKEHI